MHERDYLDDDGHRGDIYTFLGDIASSVMVAANACFVVVGLYAGTQVATLKLVCMSARQTPIAKHTRRLEERSKAKLYRDVYTAAWPQSAVVVNLIHSRFARGDDVTTSARRSAAATAMLSVVGGVVADASFHVCSRTEGTSGVAPPARSVPKS